MLHPLREARGAELGVLETQEIPAFSDSLRPFSPGGEQEDWRRGLET